MGLLDHERQGAAGAGAAIGTAAGTPVAGTAVDSWAAVTPTTSAPATTPVAMSRLRNSSAFSAVGKWRLRA